MCNARWADHRPHWCDLPEGHDGLHHCGNCGNCGKQVHF